MVQGLWETVGDSCHRVYLKHSGDANVNSGSIELHVGLEPGGLPSSDEP